MSIKYSISKRYGETFRFLRKKRNISLSYFSKIGISKSALAQFERGETMMKFDRLHRCLEELDVTLAEFELIINNFSINYQEELLIEIEKADLLKDIKKLKSIKNISKTSNYYVSLAAKSRYSQLTYKEINSIFNFLFDLPTWTSFELSLFYLVCEQFPPKLQKSLLMSAFEYMDILKETPLYRDRLLQIFYRSILPLSNCKDREMIEYILRKTDPMVREHTLFLNNIRYFSIGCYEYTFLNKQKGQTLMLEAIDIFKKLFSPTIAKYYQDIYNNYKNKENFL